MAVTCGEVREGHPVGAANSGIDLMDLTGEAVRWKPFGHCVGIEEGSINSFRCRTKYAVKSYGVCGHPLILSDVCCGPAKSVERQSMAASRPVSSPLEPPRVRH